MLEIFVVTSELKKRIHPHAQERLTQWLADAIREGCTVWAHNAEFEWLILNKLGYETDFTYNNSKKRNKNPCNPDQ